MSAKPDATAELASLTRALSAYVADLGQRLSGQRWCPFCAADRSHGWGPEPHKPDCLVSRAEDLDNALRPADQD